MTSFLPTISTSISSPALNGYWLSFTIAAGTVTYWVFELRLCRMRVRAFSTMRVPRAKPCGVSTEKVVGDGG